MSRVNNACHENNWLVFLEDRSKHVLHCIYKFWNTDINASNFGNIVFLKWKSVLHYWKLAICRVSGRLLRAFHQAFGKQPNAEWHKKNIRRNRSTRNRTKQTRFRTHNEANKRAKRTWITHKFPTNKTLFFFEERMRHYYDESQRKWGEENKRLMGIMCHCAGYWILSTARSKKRPWPWENI